MAIHRLVVALAESLGDQEKVSATADDIYRALSGISPAIHALIAEQNQTVVGAAIFFLTFSTWRGNRGVYLQDIYLDPQLRGAGCGKQLIASVASWAAAHDADHLRLSVDSNNKAAQSFYASIGMAYCEKEMIYQISGDKFAALEMP